MIGGATGDSLTYANVEQQQLEFVTYSLRPWLVLIEQAISADPDLCSPERLRRVPDRRAAAGRLEDEGRDVYALALDPLTGWMTRDEVRRLREPRGRTTAAVGPSIRNHNERSGGRMSETISAPEQRTIDVDVGTSTPAAEPSHGYAAVYDTLERGLGRLPGDGSRPARSPASSTRDVRALLNHDPNEVLGRTKSGTLRLFDEPRGLRFELDLPDSPLGENMRAAVSRGDIDGARSGSRSATRPGTATCAPSRP